MPVLELEDEPTPAALVRPLILAVLAVFAMNVTFVLIAIGRIDHQVAGFEERQATTLVDALSGQPPAAIAAVLQRSGYERVHVLQDGVASPEEIILPVTTTNGLRRGAVAFTPHRPGIDTFIKGMPYRMPVIIACVAALLILIMRIRNRTLIIEARRRQSRKLALTDPLSRLPNRRHFQHQLALEWHLTETNGQVLALYFMDLDNFKLVNDTYGHATGDELIETVAQRLLAFFSEQDFVARLSGDEFAIIHPNAGTPDQALAFGQSLVTVMAKPFNLQGLVVHASASVGIALSNMDKSWDAFGFCRAADGALYEAKQNGRNRAALFTPRLASNRQTDAEAWREDAESSQWAKPA